MNIYIPEKFCGNWDRKNGRCVTKEFCLHHVGNRDHLCNQYCLKNVVTGEYFEAYPLSKEIKNRW